MTNLKNIPLNRWIEEPFGSSCIIYRDPSIMLTRISVEKGKGCEEHRHLYRSCVYWVRRGSLILYAWVRQIEDPLVINLNPGDTYQVDRGAWHRFEGFNTTDALEMYLSELPYKIDMEDYECRE